jgi:hypothetical protein
MNTNQTKWPKKRLRLRIMAVLLLFGFSTVWVLDAAPKARSNKTRTPHSVFTIPSNPSEGRDPFFPDSTRPYAVAVAATPRSVDISSLVLKGFSGTMKDRLVIINNRTFAAGDEGNVTTSTGRIYLKCIEIKTNSVVIEVDGQRHELFYINQP